MSVLELFDNPADNPMGTITEVDGIISGNVEVPDITELSGPIVPPKLILGLLSLVCSAVGTLGCLVICLLTSFHLKTARQLPHLFFYILCLSVIDSVLLISAGLYASGELLDRWMFGYNLCQFVSIGRTAPNTFSFYVLLLICIDMPGHTWKGCRPFRQTLAIVAILLAISYLTDIPIYFRADVDAKGRRCGQISPTGSLLPVTHSATSCVVFYIIPLILSIFFAAKVCRAHKCCKLSKSLTSVLTLRYSMWAFYWLFTMLKQVAEVQNYPDNDAYNQSIIIKDGSYIFSHVSYWHASLCPLVIGSLVRQIGRLESAAQMQVSQSEDTGKSMCQIAAFNKENDVIACNVNTKRSRKFPKLPNAMSLSA